MKHLLNWMGEHPVLTVVILLIVTGFIVQLVRGH